MTAFQAVVILQPSACLGDICPDLVPHKQLKPLSGHSGLEVVWASICSLAYSFVSCKCFGSQLPIVGYRGLITQSDGKLQYGPAAQGAALLTGIGGPGLLLWEDGLVMHGWIVCSAGQIPSAWRAACSHLHY